MREKEFRIYKDDIDGDYHVGACGSTGGTVVCGTSKDQLINVPTKNKVTCGNCLEIIEAIRDYNSDNLQRLPGVTNYECSNCGEVAHGADIPYYQNIEDEFIICNDCFLAASRKADNG
jgi:hypothetical protein